METITKLKTKIAKLEAQNELLGKENTGNRDKAYEFVRGAKLAETIQRDIQ